MALLKYMTLVYLYLGLASFGFYMYVCNLGDKLTTVSTNYFNPLEEEYDYIIVGAGSAGSVIALRLSEDINVSVLVLEAGGYGGTFMDIPIMTPSLHRSLYDWQYETVPQQHCCKMLENNVSFWPSGRLIGGTGRLNNMIYTRGHPDDFQEWYKDVEDYNYERDILEYFKRAENQVGSYQNDTKYHSRNGPLIVRDLIYSTRLHEATVNASLEMGFPIRDVNGELNTGFFRPQVNMEGKWRHSTGHRLLSLFRRGNLVIKPYSIVEQILFKEKYEAYAVKHRIFKDIYITKARKAVIVSAGTVGTPKLLMLSGIGDANHLKEIDIPLVKDLPVGNNLQDHVSTGIDLVLLEQPLDINLYTIPSLPNQFQYLFLSQGPYTTVGCDAAAFLHSNCLNYSTVYEECEKKAGAPDLEFMFMPVGVAMDHGMFFRDILNLREDVWDDYYSNLSDSNALNILPMLLHPKSVGTVRLSDNNPNKQPLIDPKYFSDPSDVELLIKGIRFVQRFVKTDAMRALGAKFNEVSFPGCQHFTFDSDEYWRCYIEQVTLTVFHPVGTCKMGNEDDPTSVVDRNFKVIGTNKLFVVDASVMPSLVSAHINAAVVMIAEKAADVLKNYRRLEMDVCHLIEIFIGLTFCKVY